MSISTKKVIIIGGGFSGLATAATLAKQGHRVTIIEKNDQLGGRARTWSKDGFLFDMGPSWYWMPEVFEQFYNQFGHTASDFYELKRLSPSYSVFYKNNERIDVPATLDELYALFEAKEKGAGPKLKNFLEDAGYKYHTAMQDYVHRLSDSITEYFDVKLLIKTFQLQLFQSLSKSVSEKFTNPSLVSLLEFPVLFLGSTPQNTPAMYSMMNYADLVLGTWYPMGGMHMIARAMEQIARKQGVEAMLNAAVEKILVRNGKATGVVVNGQTIEADVVVGSGDYHHIEQVLLDEEYRQYNTDYWNKRTMSPSSLLFYIGVNKNLPALQHHNLFFDEDFGLHASEIYDTPRWPTAPLFYACVPSKTDPGVAPMGSENLFLLMPLAPGINDDEQTREKYFDIMLKRLEERIGEPFRDNIVVKRSFCIRDFEKDYNSYKGNAYGLANTLLQTAILKPKMKSKKVSNLFYTGQLTVPGPGVPPAIISGQIAAREIQRLITLNKL